MKHHFKQRFCNFCRNTIIQIDDDWCDIRLHLGENCSKMHTADDNVEPDECCVETEEPNIMRRKGNLPNDNAQPEPIKEEVNDFESNALPNVICEYENSPGHHEFSKNIERVTEVTAKVPTFPAKINHH